MPTPADEQLLAILDKWLQSLALHERYAGLDSASYARVQPWPAHERPSRWIIDLARQKTLSLRAQLEQRIRAGDTQFSEALELMAFLANLVGSEHIERFIPLATPENEQPLTRAKPPAAAAETPEPPAAVPGPREPRPVRASEAARAPEVARAPAQRSSSPPASAPRPPVAAPTAARLPTPIDNAPTREMPMAPITSELLNSTASREVPGVSVTATREMPQFAQAARRAPEPAGTPQVARGERRPHGARAATPHARTSGKSSTKHPARIAAAAKPAAAHKGGTGSAAGAASGQASRDHAREQVVADAARLMQWGRKWYELAELIARMADRPPLSEVRRILKDNKTAIEKKAGRG